MPAAVELTRCADCLELRRVRTNETTQCVEMKSFNRLSDCRQLCQMQLFHLSGRYIPHFGKED